MGIVQSYYPHSFNVIHKNGPSTFHVQCNDCGNHYLYFEESDRRSVQFRDVAFYRFVKEDSQLCKDYGHTECKSYGPPVQHIYTPPYCKIEYNFPFVNYFSD